MFGFNASKEEVLKIWEENAKRWSSVGPPWRPSRGDIDIYRELCKEKIHGNVLILGSTPEIRDLAASKNSRLVLVDISPAMLQKMAELAKIAKPENEIWVKSDWIEATLPENYFDLVIGDMVWWVVSVQKQFELRNKIASLLKPDGLFVSRFRLRGPDRLRHDRLAVINKYLEDLESNPARKQAIRDAMVSHLHDITVNASQKRIDRAKTKSLLMVAADKITNSVHRDFLHEASGCLLSADWTSQTQEEILATLAEKFTIIAEKRADDYDAEFYPIFSLTKKA